MLFMESESDRIAREQREFALRQLARERGQPVAEEPEPDDDESDAPVSASPNPPIVQLLEGAVRALLFFHTAEDKVSEQMRVVSLIRDAEAIAPPVAVPPLRFLRQEWAKLKTDEILARYKNKDFANMIRGVELVARTSLLS